MAVAQPNERRHGEVRARRLAADRQRAFVALGEPQRHRLAIVRRGRVRILGREPVLDADHLDAAGERKLLEPFVLEPRRAVDEAAAVQVQVDAADVGRREDANGDAGDDTILGEPRHVERLREQGAAAAQLSGALDCHPASLMSSPCDK